MSNRVMLRLLCSLPVTICLAIFGTGPNSSMIVGFIAAFFVGAGVAAWAEIVDKGFFND